MPKNPPSFVKRNRFGRISNRMLYFIIGLIIVIAICFGWHWLFGSKKKEFNTISLVVKRDHFIQDILGRGNAESSSNVDITSPADGSTTIVELLPEGSLVKKGEVVAKLDTQRIENRILTMQDIIDNSPGEIEGIQLSILRQEYALEEYLSGTLKTEWMQIENTLARKQEDLRQSTERIDYTKKLVQSGYTAQAQLDVDEVDIQKNRNSVKKSLLDRLVLLKYSSEKTITEIVSNLEFLHVSLEESMKWMSQVEKDIKRLNEQLESCSIKAPNDGRLVYANQVLRPGRNESEVIKEGASVHKGQLMFRLPDPSQMQIRALVPEANMFLIKPGMKVFITFDVLRIRQFDGEVIKVNNFPELDRHSPIKKYAVLIKINDPEQIRNAGIDLRTGISADIRIIVKEVPDVLLAPVHSIVSVNGKDFCLIYNNRTWDYREVLLGPSNNSDIVVREGLVEGDQIVAGAKRYQKEVQLPEASQLSLYDEQKKKDEVQKKKEEEEINKLKSSLLSQDGPPAGGPPNGPVPGNGPPGGGPGGPPAGPTSKAPADVPNLSDKSSSPDSKDKKADKGVGDKNAADKDKAKKPEESEEDKLKKWYKNFEPGRRYLSLTTIELCRKLDSDANDIATKEEVRKAAPELLVIYDEWDRNHNGVLEYTDIAIGMYKSRTQCRKMDLFNESGGKVVLKDDISGKPSSEGRNPEMGGQQ